MGLNAEGPSQAVLCGTVLSMQGCKRTRGETGEGATLSETEVVDADMNKTAYKRTGEPTQKPVENLTGKGTIKRKAEELPPAERLKKRPNAGKTTNRRMDDRECLKRGKRGHLAKVCYAVDW